MDAPARSDAAATSTSARAMKNASPVGIEQLAGHPDLSTTQKYMHLGPEFVGGAITLLDTAAVETL
jgi:site-specific recombinase XerC